MYCCCCCCCYYYYYYYYYCLEQFCTTDEPQTVVTKRSKLHCATACSEQHECREYNFDDTAKDCSLYKHKALFFAAQPKCSRYKVRCSCYSVLEVLDKNYKATTLRRFTYIYVGLLVCLLLFFCEYLFSRTLFHDLQRMYA